MTFDKFIVNAYDEHSFIFCVMVLAAAVTLIYTLCFALSDLRVKNATHGYALAVITALCLTGVIAISCDFSNRSHEIDNKNYQTAENNLKKKYDIESVLWAESSASADDTSGSHYIKVQDKDSNILKFRYKVDKETNEPSLLNEEINAGSVRANDLLIKR